MIGKLTLWEAANQIHDQYFLDLYGQILIWIYNGALYSILYGETPIAVDLTPMEIA